MRTPGVLNLLRARRLSFSANVLVLLDRSTPRRAILVEKLNRGIDAGERSLSSEHDEHIENPRTCGHSGQRETQRLKNLAGRRAARFSERTQRVLERLSLPRGRASECVARRLQGVTRCCGVLPGFRDGVRIVIDPIV